MTEIRNIIEITELEGVELAAGLLADVNDDTIYFNKPIVNKSGAIFTEIFCISSINSEGKVEDITIPKRVGSGASVTAGFSDDGMIAYGVIRGVDKDGTNMLTTNAANLLEFNQGDQVVCPVGAVQQTQIHKVIEGEIATGGLKIILGDGSTDQVEIARVDSGGVERKLLRATGSQALISANGVDEVDILNITDGELVKVSATDTVAGYLESKMNPGTNMTRRIEGSGADEKIYFDAESRREGVELHEVYTPASWDGGTSAETNIALWNDVSDASLRIRANGVDHNLDGMDMTDTGPLGEVANMGDVANVIQYYLRLSTGGNETVTFNVNSFRITSADTTAASEISNITTSTGTVGTDISGATWTDLTTGSQTIRVLDVTASAGKVPVIKPNGKVFAGALTGTNSYVENYVLAVDGNGDVKMIPLSASALLENENTGFNHTGTTALTSVYSYEVPANILGTGNALRITAPITDLDINSSISIQLFYGGVFIANVAPNLGVDNQFGELQATLIASGATDSQKGWIKLITTTGSNEKVYALSGTSSIDSTVAQDIELRIQLGNSGDKVTAPFVLLELLKQ